MPSPLHLSDLSNMDTFRIKILKYQQTCILILESRIMIKILTGLCLHVGDGCSSTGSPLLLFQTAVMHVDGTCILVK